MTRNQEPGTRNQTVTEWLKPGRPLAVWWERNYGGLREVASELAARLKAARPGSTSSEGAGAAGGTEGQAPLPGLDHTSIPLDTPGLRYYDYATVGGAIDYRMRMEFTRMWGGDPERSGFIRAWARGAGSAGSAGSAGEGKAIGGRGALAHASARMLADCAPVLAGRGSYIRESLPALARLLDEQAAHLDQLAPWDWSGPYASLGRDEEWLLNYCFVLAELDSFYRNFVTSLDFTPLLSPSGQRSVAYAYGRPTRSGFWGESGRAQERYSQSGGQSGERVQEGAGRIRSELERGWPLFSYLLSTHNPRLEELAAMACSGQQRQVSQKQGAPNLGRGAQRLRLLRGDLEAQMALWRRNKARRAAHPPQVIAANPIFRGSARLPADGDLIVRSREGDGYLLDFKSGKRVERAGVLMLLRQILTYALMDEADEYGIGMVGFYFTRYGVWAYWRLEELLDKAISGTGRDPTGGVDAHRQALRRMLLDLRQPDALDLAIPRR